MKLEPSGPQQRYEEMRREHEELRELLGKVRRVIAKRAESVAHVSDILASLVTHVETHFADEEVEGLFDELAEQAPRLTERTEQLRQEHVQLRAAIGKLAELAASGDTSSDWWQQLETAFHQFSTQLMHHETKENELLQEAYTEDIGSQD